MAERWERVGGEGGRGPKGGQLRRGGEAAQSEMTRIEMTRRKLTRRTAARSERARADGTRTAEVTRLCEEAGEMARRHEMRHGQRGSRSSRASVTRIFFARPGSV